MINEEFASVGLYNHNATSYDKVRKAFSSGKDVVSIVHATGTGKSYNALQLAYDNKGKKIVYVVPSNGIIEHLRKIIDDNPNLDFDRDFPNLEFRTYQSFINLSKDEIESIPCDLLILDEFHHIGAPIWSQRINTVLETHPNIKVFGMTAYTIRDRGTSYERDMADPDGIELFSNTIESRYDLCDAMIDGVLPKPIYKSAYTNLIGLESKLEEKVKKMNATTKEYQEYMNILTDIKKRIHEAPSIPSILRKSIKQNGKYIYFCPPSSEEGTNDIETIKEQAKNWFKDYVKEEDIVFYTSTSDMGKEGEYNRDAFYDDKTLDGKNANNKLRIMFAINQYNEGIHAPNIDGVIMGRGTTSDIVYFEQLGRALSVRGNTKEEFEKLEKYPIEELIEMCESKSIPFKENTTKEELIEKLIAPVVIDLANNFDYIKDIENNLKDRIKELNDNKLGARREIKIKDASFDIEIENQNIYEMLKYVMDRLTMTWEDKYNLAKAYYEHHGNLEIPERFETINGYEYEKGGIKLGHWLNIQRQAYKGKKDRKITQEQIDLLDKIGMRWEKIDYMDIWMEKYNLAESYYEHHGNLKIPFSFETINGYEYEKGGIKLGGWLNSQRQAYNGKVKGKLTQEQIDLLDKIGMRWEIIDKMDSWMKKYNLAKAYYEHHGNLEIPYSFETINGYEYEKGGVKLGIWLNIQRQAYKGKKDRKITQEQIDLLDKIGMRWEKIDYMDIWMEKYNLAESYYEHHGNLKIPFSFETINGYEYEKGGIKLGIWLNTQREAYKGKGYLKITEEQIQLLENIGMIWNIKKNNEEVRNVCEENNIDIEKNKTVIKRISLKVLQAKIAFLKDINIQITDNNGLLHEIFSISSADMKEQYGLTIEELITEYLSKNKGKEV